MVVEGNAGFKADIIRRSLNVQILLDTRDLLPGKSVTDNTRDLSPVKNAPTRLRSTNTIVLTYFALSQQGGVLNELHILSTSFAVPLILPSGS